MLLQFQAEHFYNAYKVLQANNEALIDRLENSSSAPSQKSALGIGPTMGVEVVCLAFSVELYIKDVHHAINGKKVRGHDILKLFEKLPDKVQQDIFTYRAIAHYGWNFEEFKLEIKEISDGFEKWRYSHEHTSLGYKQYFAIVFIEALISTADSIRRNNVQNP